METSSWSGCQLIYSDSSSLSSTLRLVWCFGFAAMTTSPTLSQFFIGCVYHNGSILRLRSWRSECCMVWLRHTWISWFVLLTCLVVALAAYVHQRHISWASLHTGWNPSAVGRFRSPHQLCGTLPSEIQSSPSLTLFRQRLKTYLFQKSFPDVLL